ncbi:MAG: carnitine monooxygenase subunit YeaW [Candidatus Pelagadaptatus aseana]|uniref:aromatic ring-hydroxylating oxygenase subunit alpha n=1 Tax=Candidatus Pelagadaptatus aseana TaxID=3120508 RepID=UPI0039B1F109
MKKERQINLIERVVGAANKTLDEMPSVNHRIDVKRYFETDELILEQKAIFRKVPTIVAHVTEVAEPGNYVTEEIDGVPLIILRDHSGELRVLVNACRHRGARLLQGEKGQCKRLLVCPYHAWSFKLDGSLAAVPEKELFGDEDFSKLNLVPVQFAQKHGFIWVVIDGDPDEPLDVDGFLGESIVSDLEGFEFAGQVMHKRVALQNECNWKLVMDAFAEGYHLKTLHKNSLSRFFLDASIYDDCYPHTRQMGGRKTLTEEIKKDPEQWDLRLNTTLFYNIFPNTILVFHPHWISQMSLFPVGADQMRVVHRMLVPEAPANDEVAAKLDASFEHIQGTVFEKEDLAISVDIQKTLRSGANDHFVVGGYEEGVRIFHQARDEFIQRYLKAENNA